MTFFEKEYSRTSKSIDNNKKALSKIIEIRSRRNSDQHEVALPVMVEGEL